MLDVLRDGGLLPGDTLAALLVGSAARNRSHQASDIDVLVATEQTPGAGTLRLTRSRAGDYLVGAVAEFGGRTVEVHYWSQPQVDALLAAASWEAFDDPLPGAEAFSVKERQFVDRLSTAQVLTGAPWHQVCHALLNDSAFGPLGIRYSLDAADAVLGKARGLLRSGDIQAAVLAAKDVFDHTVDALLLGAGELGPLRKWRARQFHDAAPRLPIDFDTYWALETMRDFDPRDPGDWVGRVAAFLHTTALYTELDPRPGRYLDPGDAGGADGGTADAGRPSGDTGTLARYPRWCPGVRPRRVRDGLLLLTDRDGVLLHGPQDRLACQADGRHTVAEIAAATAAELGQPTAELTALARQLFADLDAEGYLELAGSADGGPL